MLYQLKRAGIAQHDLVRVYVSVIRPILEYACPVWHMSLPSYLTQHRNGPKKSPEVCVPWPELLSYFTSNKTFHVALTQMRSAKLLHKNEEGRSQAESFIASH